MGAAVLAMAFTLSCGAEKKATGDDGVPRNLAIISLDTVRRDHLPTYGYDRATARAVDALARESLVFDNAYTQETNTNPSHASMFTGVYPHVHGSVANLTRLPSHQLTLAEILRLAGFRTAGFISGVIMHRWYSGLDQGFEVYDDQFEGYRRDGAVAAKRARAWISAREASERWFLFLHLYDAHGPYVPHGRYVGLFSSKEAGAHLDFVPRYQRYPDKEGNLQTALNDYVDRYDAMIRYADDLVAGVLAEIDLDDTVVVILSDHGETLGERYRKLDHGGQVFDEQIRIPLIVHVPGLAPRRVDDLVETVDLLPTVLDWLDVPIPEDRTVQGASLAPQMRGERSSGRKYTFSSARSGKGRHTDRGYRLDPLRRIYSVRSADWKLIRYPGVETDYLELYDLRSDPGEQRNLATRLAYQRDAHAAALAVWLGGASPVSPDPDQIDPEKLEKLEALGYVGD
jgi:arylsulfatase A-like enzyme